MLDPTQIWLTVENEEDKKLAEDIKRRSLDVYPYKTIEIPYYRLKRYLVLDEIQIGKVEGKNYDVLAGELEIDGLTYKVNGFVPIVTLGADPFKRFLENLTKDIRHKHWVKVKIMYCCKDQAVWVEVEGHIGAIAPKRKDA